MLRAVRRTRDARLGMSFVPDVVRELGAPRDVAKRAVLAAAAAGVIELRPEGGLNRLSRDELDDSPPGPQGTRLSWAREV